MRIIQRINVMNVSSALVVTLVVLSLLWSWSLIHSAIDRQTYAREVKIHIVRLQSELISIETSKRFKNNRWKILSQQLNGILHTVPKLKPNQQAIQKSLQTQSNSIALLFAQLAKLNNNKPIKHHLFTRLLLQVQLIQEDSIQLAMFSEQEIKAVIERQSYIIATLLIIGLGLLLFSSRGVSHAVKHSIHDIQKAVDSIRRGQYKSIRLNYKTAEFGLFADEFNKMSQELKKTMITRDVLEQMVKARTEELKHLADTDTLTQVANRRALYERGEMEFERANRHSEPLSLLILDCDFFKNINDTYGHLTGDRVLIYLCREIEKQIRNIDFLARYGGEEFVVLLPKCEQIAAVESAKRIQKGLANHSYKDDSCQIDLTLSIGISCLSEIHRSFESLINDADLALLNAKTNGRNRIEVNGLKLSTH